MLSKFIYETLLDIVNNVTKYRENSFDLMACDVCSVVSPR